MNRKAMTLAELLVMMIVIGVIALMAIITVKPFKKAQKSLYLKAFNALAEATYNSVEDNDTLFESELPTDFCEGLASYINSNSDSCKNITSTNLIEDTRTDFSNIDAHLLANNAMRFYFSGLKTYNSKDSDNIEFNLKYFIVYIDLNGENNPNTIVWTTRTANDVVAFAALSSGDVIPLGRPQIDTSYLTARVYYQPTTTYPNGKYSDAMSYYDAKNMAWGSKEFSENKKSININAALPENSPVKLTNYPTAPAVDTANGCSESTDSICDLYVENFY